MSDPLVSVVITNHNYARFLPIAIDSVLSQTYPHVEVVAVDDGSTDDSAAILERYGSSVRVLRQPRRGQTAALNRGAAAMRGEVACFLDADDVLLPDVLERAVARFQDGEVVAVQWRLGEVDELGRPTGQLWPSGELARGDVREVLLRDGPTNWPTVPTSGNAWARRFLDDVMPLPEKEIDFGVGGAAPDAALFMLAQLSGAVDHLDAPGGLYRLHGGNDFATSPIAAKVARQAPIHDFWIDHLAARCRRLGLEVDPERWKQRSYLHRMQRAGEAIRQVVPPRSQFILLDDDQWDHHHGDREVVAERYAVPFPERDGQYWGRPESSAAAIAELERMRAGGQRILAVPWSAFWWLDFYEGLARHLETRFTCRWRSEDIVIFDLTAEPDLAAEPDLSAEPDLTAEPAGAGGR